MKTLRKSSLLFVLVMLLFISFGVTGCTESSEYKQIDMAVDDSESTLVLVEKRKLDNVTGVGVVSYYFICYDRDTKVMYLITGIHGDAVSVTPMYNADGTLKLYKE